VSFGRVTLRIPATWPVYNLARQPAVCPRLDRHAAYLGAPGADPACPAAGLGGKTEAVQILPASAASPDLRAASTRSVVGGLTALTNQDAAITHTIIDVLPAAGAEVSISYGTDPALARSIQASITVRPASEAAARAAVAALRPAAIPAVPAQGIYEGPGFDACTAPSAKVMSRWLASPYRAVGVYIGGVNRACAQPNLTADWLATIRRAGWHYFPFYVGLQASCVEASGDAEIVPSKAAAEGSAAATDAAAAARNLGIPARTPLIYDMEAYSGCGKEVITFLSAWDARLHAEGYAAGIYESFTNISDLVAAEGSMTEPDIIHYADWDGKATTTSSYMPSTLWTNHQRLHQYLGGHNQAWGGTTIDIDADQLNANLGGKPGAAPTPTPTPTPVPTPTPTYGPTPPPFPFPFPYPPG
jgi:hypothetical protein